MKIALGQIEVVAGDPAGNVGRMLNAIVLAAKNDAKLIAFPELCVGGYLLGDLYLDDEYCLDLMRYNEQIANAARENQIAVSFGNIYLEEDINARLIADGYGDIYSGFHPNQDGRRRRYNAVYVFNKFGEPAKRLDDCLLPKGVQPKTNLPNYRIFDDERYFFSLNDHCADFGQKLENAYQPFLIDNDYVGFETCEDLWCEDYRVDFKALNPTKYLVMNGAEAIVNASASPWTYGKNGARDRRVINVQSECDINAIVRGVPFFYVNCIGVQNNGKNLITFDGGSTIYDRKGAPVAFANLWEQEIIYADTRRLPVTHNRVGMGWGKIGEKYLAIRAAIKRFVSGKMIVGVSGGVDSAVSAALFVDALGADKVIGINMPSKHNKDITKAAAKKLCENLGIPYRVVPIETLAQQTRITLEDYMVGAAVAEKGDYGQPQIPAIVDENLQAKTRAIPVLSNIAQIEGGMYCCNGNKVELAIGYYTLDADGRGAINLLGDLTKEEVYELGYFLNERIFSTEAIPTEILNSNIIKPSAELATDQYDPIKVGYHCRILEKMTNYHIAGAAVFMEQWLAGTLHEFLGLDKEVLQRFEMDDGKKFVEDLEWFLGRERNQVFKRVQSVPLVLLSKTAYGYDRRESILPPFKLSKQAIALRERILAAGIYQPK